jgi:type IV secretion system protein VirB9
VKRMRLAGSGIVFAILSSGVQAELAPRSAGFDSHVQQVAYNPLNVVRLVGNPTNSTQVIFGTGEEITQVAIGDADAWLAQPAGNLLFIKPIRIALSTNMQVVTKRLDGPNRLYQFRLFVARRNPQGASPAIFAVSFTYPDDDARTRTALTSQRTALADEKAMAGQLARAWSEGPRNWRYVAQGSSAIEPTEVSDNGRQTAFRFPGNMRLPTIYTAAPDGSETIVAYTMIGDRAVVQTTARGFTLRDGQKVLRIVNKGFDPVGRNPGTGTGSPAYQRTVKGQDQ